MTLSSFPSSHIHPSIHPTMISWEPNTCKGSLCWSRLRNALPFPFHQLSAYSPPLDSKFIALNLGFLRIQCIILTLQSWIPLSSSVSHENHLLPELAQLSPVPELILGCFPNRLASHHPSRATLKHKMHLFLDLHLDNRDCQARNE